MKIALVSTYPPGKGSLNEYAYHFITHLRRKPEVDAIYVLADELPDGQAYPVENPQPGDAPLTIIPCWRFGSWTNALNIVNAVRRIKPDMVLFNMQFATFADSRVPAALGLLTPWLVKAAGFPVTVLLHNIMETVDLQKAGFGSNPLLQKVTRTFGAIFTRMLLQSDMIAVTIPKYVEILTDKYGADNVVLAPHGAFEQTPPPRLEPSDGPMQIMTFGKFGTYKKVDILIEAFNLLQQEQPNQLTLVIAGTDSPNTHGYLAEMQQKYAAVPNVHYTGYVAEEDVPRIFSAASVVVFPYNSTTGSSGVLHQAGSYGRAVVLPRLGDFAELITEEGYVGEFFAPDDARSLADAIARYINNPQHRQQHAMQNYLAASGLPMSEVVDWYLLHFERLLGTRQLIQA
jgi:glycosyltransferase involved in cell wall biosynthesis